MRIWGVTGLMGAGKSIAMAHLKSRGFSVVDADAVSREVMDATRPEGAQNTQNLAALLGRGILAADGRTLDRRKLRLLMANDVAVRDRLEAFMHPLIRASLKNWAVTRAKGGDRLAFVEGSRIVESGYARTLDGCIVVTAPAELRLARVMARDGMTRDDTLKMFALQDDTRARTECGVVWENSLDPQKLTEQIDSFLSNHGH